MKVISVTYTTIIANFKLGFRAIGFNIEQLDRSQLEIDSNKPANAVSQGFQAHVYTPSTLHAYFHLLFWLTKCPI